VRKWDGSYWTRANSTRLTGNLTKDAREGRLSKVFDNLPIEVFSEANGDCPGDSPLTLNTRRVWDQHPAITIPRARTMEKQRNSDVRVCYAHFVADLSAADEPVFDPALITDQLSYLK
jgi:hypothetical protein